MKKGTLIKWKCACISYRVNFSTKKMTKAKSSEAIYSGIYLGTGKEFKNDGFENSEFVAERNGQKYGIRKDQIIK